MNRALPTVVVAPITSRIKNRESPIAPILEAGHPLPLESAVLTFQVRAVDATRLDGPIGTLTPEQMSAVAHGMAISLGLLAPGAIQKTQADPQGP